MASVFTTKSGLSIQTKSMKKVDIAETVTYKLTQIIEEPIRVSDATGHRANSPDLFFTSCTEKYFAEDPLPKLGTSNDLLVSVMVYAKPKAYPDVLMIFQNTKLTGTTSDFIW